MQPVRPFPSAHASGQSCYLGTTHPMRTPGGVPFETGDNEPVDLWLVLRRGQAHLMRSPSELDAPPPHGGHAGPSSCTLDELCREHRDGVWNWYRQEYAKIAVRAFNEGALPDPVVAWHVDAYGFAALRGVLEDAGEPLTAEGERRLMAFAPDTPAFGRR